MKKLIKNAKIINEKNEISNVHILINEDIIEKIYENSENIDNLSNISVIDAENNLLLPGFVNSYSNLLKKFFYDNTNFDNFDEFNEEFENFLVNINNEEKYLIYKFEIENAIKNGITTILDEDFFNLSLKKAVKDTGINFVYKIGLSSCLDVIDQNLLTNFINTNENFVLGLNNVFFNNEENFLNLINLSKLTGKPIVCNGSKNILEEGNVDLDFKTSTIKLLESYGFLDYENLLYSQNLFEKDDLKLLKDNLTVFSFSPSFNLSFACPVANIYALNLQNKVSIASFKNDMFLEMFLTKNLENNSYDKINLFSYFEVYNLIKNNAKILSLQNVGEIKEGYKADFIILNESKETKNINQIFSTLSSKDILYTIIDGEIKYNKFYENIKTNKGIDEILKRLNDN